MGVRLVGSEMCIRDSPYMIGVSAGICDGFSYISKQRERNLKILMNHRNDKRYMGAGNLLKERSLFGLDFVYDTIPNKLYPFDWKTFNEYKGTIKVGVTNAWTGTVSYTHLRAHETDSYLVCRLLLEKKKK